MRWELCVRLEAKAYTSVPTCQVLQRCETGPESQLPEQVIWGYEALSNPLEETSTWLSLLSSVVVTCSMWLLCCYSLMVYPGLAWVNKQSPVVACFFLTSVTCEKDWRGTTLWILIFVYFCFLMVAFGYIWQFSGVMLTTSHLIPCKAGKMWFVGFPHLGSRFFLGSWPMAMVLFPLVHVMSYAAVNGHFPILICFQDLWRVKA